MDLYRVTNPKNDDPDAELEVIDVLDDGLRGLQFATAIWRLIDKDRGDAFERALNDAIKRTETGRPRIADPEAVRRILRMLDGIDEAAESLADANGFLPPDKAKAAKEGYPEVGEDLVDEHGRRGYSLINSLARVREARFFLEESLRLGAGTVMD